MNRVNTFAISLLAMFAVCSAASADSQAEQSKAEVVEIALGEIWAAHSARRNSIWHDHPPKTRDIAELERENFRLTRKELWDPIIDALDKASPHGSRASQKALPGFAVVGSGREALRGAYEVLVEEKAAREIFTPDDEIALVFFSHPSSGRFVQLEQVQRTDNVISIKYRLVPYLELNLSLSFALIPVGKLPEGTYRVEMVQLPMDKKFVKWGFPPAAADFVQTTICQPFEFRVMRTK